MVIVAESKYIDHASLAAKRKESQKQLRDTVRRITDALFGEEAGILCRQDFTPDEDYGDVEIADHIEDCERSGVRLRGFTYFSVQAADEVLAGGKLRLRFGVREGSTEEAEDIGLDVAMALHRHGLKMIWDGRRNTPILVEMVWRRWRSVDSITESRALKK